MEPRWKKEWLKDVPQHRDGEPFRFLGGTNDFDLWLDDFDELRFVTGETMAEWDWVKCTYGGTLEWGSKDVKHVDHDKWLKEAVQYLTLFAPWALERVYEGRVRREAAMG